MRCVAVTGGAGRLGNVVVRQLRQRGDRVRVLEPLPEPPASIAGLEVEFVSGSILDRQAVAGTLVGPFDFEPSILGRALLDLHHRRIPLLMQVVSDYVEVRDVAAGVLRAMLPWTLLIARMSGKPALFTANMLRSSVSNRIVSHDKAARELGFVPRPTRAALAGALEFYRAAGWARLS